MSASKPYSEDMENAYAAIIEKIGPRPEDFNAFAVPGETPDQREARRAEWGVAAREWNVKFNAELNAQKKAERAAAHNVKCPHCGRKLSGANAKLGYHMTCQDRARR